MGTFDGSQPELDGLATIDLVRSAQAGDRKAIDALFARYLPRVRQIVALRLGYGGRRFAAYDDLVQDAMLRLFRKLDAFQERSEGSFRNWMAVCVMNSMRNSLRQENAARVGGGRVAAMPEGDGDDAASLVLGKDPGPSTLYRGQELLERVEAALLALKEEHREAILLRKFCEMSYDEVAATLGLPSQAAARKLVSRAVACLREQLGEGAAPAEENGQATS